VRMEKIADSSLAFPLDLRLGPVAGGPSKAACRQLAVKYRTNGSKSSRKSGMIDGRVERGGGSLGSACSRKIDQQRRAAAAAAAAAVAAAAAAAVATASVFSRSRSLAKDSPARDAK